MGLNKKLQALESLLLLNLTVEELFGIQTITRTIEHFEMDNYDSDSYWHSLLKQLFENQSNIILEKVDPVENEYISN